MNDPDPRAHLNAHLCCMLEMLDEPGWGEGPTKHSMGALLAEFARLLNEVASVKA